MKINEDLLINSKINGNIYSASFRCKNLFNKNSVTNNRRIDSYGDPYVNNGYFLSDFIEILPSTRYTLSKNTVDSGSLNCYALYDDNKNFIIRSGFYASKTHTFTTSSNAKYMRITDTDSNLDSLQVEFGSAATQYMPFTYVNDDVDNAIDRLNDVTSVIYQGVLRGTYPITTKAHSGNTTSGSDLFLETRYTFMNTLNGMFPTVSGFTRKYVLRMTCGGSQYKFNLKIGGVTLAECSPWGADNNVSSVTNFYNVTSIINSLPSGHLNITMKAQDYWYLQNCELLIYDIPNN